MFNRRRFIVTAAASASAVFLKGCLGNPPDTTGGVGNQGAPVTAATVSAEQAPETTKVKLGYIPIIESSPLIIALQKGFFAKYGMTEVEVSKQANWGAARDNVKIGSDNGGIDGGQWQMPMPYLINEGVITGGQKVPMYVLAQLNTQGNGIAISKSHLGKGIGLDISKTADYIKSFPKTQGRKFRAAYTFPNANQDFWVRYWFAAGGVDPDQDIELLAVPPAETVQGMRNGTMDAFSTGDPWPLRIVTEDIGFMSALTADMWPFHPEEYLALRADWVDKHPKATKAILKGLMEAQKWIDENPLETAKIVSGRNFFNIAEKILQPPYKGDYKMGDGKTDITDKNKGPLFWKDPRGSVSYPYKSHDLWFLTETIRWQFHKNAIPDLDVAKKLIDKVNREDLWKEAATEAGFVDVIPTSTSRGVETFFDGIKFDPDNPEAYLNAVKIKRA